MMSRAESYSTPRKAEVSPTSAVNKNNVAPVAGKQQLDDIQRQVENINHCNFPNLIVKQECIPVGYVPSAAVAVTPAMQAPCHAHPPPHMPPPTMHAPCHACPPALHTPHPCQAYPPATHAPSHACLPCHTCPSHHTPTPNHACPLPCYTCPPYYALPPVNRITDVCENITLPQLCCGR